MYDHMMMKSLHRRHIAMIISSKKIYGLYGLFIVEIRGDVTRRGGNFSRAFGHYFKAPAFEKCNIISRKGRGDSMVVWNFSENSSVLVSHISASEL